MAKKVSGKSVEDRADLERRMEYWKGEIAAQPPGAVYKAMKQVERLGIVDGTFPIEGASPSPDDDNRQWWEADE